MVRHDVPRGSGRQGAALHVVLAVVAILVLLASSMVALSTMSLNLLNSFHNGQVAQNEADTGLARLLYAVADRQTFGKNQVDEIRGCVTPGFADPESYHYVTFNPGMGFPYSVNNLDGTRPSGYAGRAVPSRMIHAFVTGHCRGQYRTIEVVLERPPFPFAVATSGRIRSDGPLVAQGTTSTGKFQANDLSRPGNVASNSTSQDKNNPAVYIGTDTSHPDLQTLITGFVQSSGTVTIAQPAVVTGGIRPTTDAVKLPDIDVSRFDNSKPDRETGKMPEGVVEISPDTFGDQTLDVMYHCSHNLTYTGNLTLDNAFLYVQGDLTILGGIKGTGGIVVDGNVTVEGDTTLESNNRVALVAKGDATLKGNGNYFQGLLYTRRNLKASHVTVLGNMVVSSNDSTQGNTELDQVRTIDNPDAASLKFTSTSSTNAKAQQPAGSSLFRITPQGIFAEDHPNEKGGRDGWYTEDATGKKMQEFFYGGSGADAAKQADLAKANMMNMKFDDPTLAIVRGMAPDAGEVWKAVDAMKDASATYQANAAKLAAYDTWKATPEPRSPNTTGVNSDAEAAALVAANQALVASYPDLANKLAAAYSSYYQSHASKSGAYKERGKTINVRKDYNFDLNQFLADAQSLKMKYWHVSYVRL